MTFKDKKQTKRGEREKWEDLSRSGCIISKRVDFRESRWRLEIYCSYWKIFYTPICTALFPFMQKVACPK